MFIWVLLHPPCKDFPIKNLLRCVRGGFVWPKAKFSLKLYLVKFRRHSAYTQYEKDDVLRILSMKKTTSCVYSVKFRMMVVTREILFYTEYMQNFFYFILSIHRKPSILYWAYTGRSLVHTEYMQDVIFFILSINVEKFIIFYDKTFNQ